VQASILVPVTPKPDPLLEEIEALLSDSGGRDDPARLEHTLTDGYARALTLEAERSRIKKRIGEVAIGAGEKDSAAEEELSALVRQLTTTDDELGSLRALLTRLRSRYSAAHARTA
jgi:hypothetical protein